MKNFDIVIVGAGTGGCSAAITAAKKGLSACLIDFKEKKRIGDKVCGDGTGSVTVRWARKALGADLMPAVLNKGMGGIIYGPDRVNGLKLETKTGIIIDRHKFGQLLLKAVLRHNVKLLDSTRVQEPIIEDNTVVGVKTSKGDIRGKVTIDASGAIAALRDKVVLKDSCLEINIGKDAFAAAYREVRLLKKDIDDPDYSKIYFSNEITSGGYIWYFPGGKLKVNIGIGGKINPEKNYRRLTEEEIRGNPLFEGSTCLHAGGGLVPVRRPLDSAVANGFMVVGDAALHAGPTDGGGIWWSMIAGHLAVETAAEAIKRGDVSEDSLWLYNRAFMTFCLEERGKKLVNHLGARQASLEVMKRFLQSVSDDDLNYLAASISQKDIDAVYNGISPSYLARKATELAGRAAQRPGLVKGLLTTLIKMQKAFMLYKNYPADRQRFPAWKRKADKIFR